MKKTKIVLTTILLAASTWLAKGQVGCTLNPCTGTNTPLTCQYVCNGTFSVNNGPPTQISPAGSGANSEITRACGWSNAFTGYTPDYFHSAATTGSVDIPCNLVGNENYQFDDG